ncbi:MAG TPA: type II secretion system protein [Phycisphaerae bacterium]|nr:type II secretion system protein [Phycisphaerae bacterium]
MTEPKDSRGFTLIELLVVVAIIGLLVAILLPSLAKARDTAKGAACASYLRTFGSAFEVYASSNRGVRSSGAFDYLRDGDVRKIGWVADVINLRVGSPGKMLCPTNRFQVNEKVADYCGAASTGTINPNRHPNGIAIPIVPIGNASAEFWTRGYNTNYTTTWHFSRGDPTAADGYGSNGSTIDPSKCPMDGDGPLDERHLGGGLASPDRIAVMGDSRAGDSSDSLVSQAYANAINAFADKQVIDVGEYTVESFTDGMSVDYSSLTGTPGQMGHEFNDIEPLHNADKNGVGGYANVLFADGHVTAVWDNGGYGNEPDGFLGPYKSGNRFEINQSAFREIREQMWYGRLRSRPRPGGGSIE